MIFVDASAIVALLCREASAERIAGLLDKGEHLCTSPIAMLEAVLAIVHRKDYPPRLARDEVSAFAIRAKIAVVAIDADLFRQAVVAFDQYGKGRHSKAKLNMGDCFAYAASKAQNASILFVGDDFNHTDLRDALADNT